jgi:hypothetical protein
MPQDSVAREGRPRLAEVAFALVCVAGLCAVVFAAVLPLQIGRVVDAERAAATKAGTSIAEFEQQLVVGVIVACAITAVFTGLLIWQAFRFRAGRPQGRFWIVVLTALALVPILLTPATVLTVVVLAVADLLMFLPVVSAWLRRSESARSRARLSGLTPS